MNLEELSTYDLEVRIKQGRYQMLGASGKEKKNGYMIGWGKYCRTAVPATIIVVLISMVCIFVRYC